MYAQYKRDYPDTDVTYTLYKYIISSVNKKTVEALLEGKRFNLGHKLGAIYIKRIARNFSKPQINWHETMKLRKAGEEVFVYYTEDYYRFSWEKSRCVVANRSVYCFEPTKGPLGNTRKLAKYLHSDEFAHLNFRS